MDVLSLLSSVISSSSKMSGEMVSFSCSDNPEQDPTQPVLVVHGRREGFIYRILESLQLIETEFSLSIDSNYIVVSGTPNNYEYFPTNEVHNFATSYGKNRLYLFLTVVFAIFACFSLLMSIGESEFLVFVIMNALLAGLFNYLYKGSEAMGIGLQMISSDRSRTTVGIRVKGSNVEHEYLEKATQTLKFVHQNYALNSHQVASKAKGNAQANAISLSKR